MEEGKKSMLPFLIGVVAGLGGLVLAVVAYNMFLKKNSPMQPSKMPPGQLF